MTWVDEDIFHNFDNQRMAATRNTSRRKLDGKLS